MRHNILLLIALLTISACKNNRLEGTWIEVKEYNNPQIYEFKFGKCILRDFESIDTFKYSIQNTNLVLISETDTFYKPFNLSFDSILTIENYIHFRKANSDWFLNDIINELGTKVNLPEIKGQKIKLNNCNELYFVSFEDNKNIKIWKNGLVVRSDYELYIAIEATKILDMDCIKLHTICADKNIPYKFIFNIKRIFRFSNENKICYAVKNNNDSTYHHLYGYTQKLSPMSKMEFEKVRNRITEQMNDNSNSINSFDKIEFQPVYYEVPMLQINKIENSRRTLIQLYNDSLLRNKHLIKRNEFLSTLKESIINDNGRHILFYYVNNDVTYGNYIKFLELIYNVFYDLRNKMSIEKYNKPFELLPYTVQIEIMNHYPLAISEINKEELIYF